MKTHAAVPFLNSIDANGVARIYFTSRDEQDRSSIGWFRINLNNPRTILNISQEPVLRFSSQGYFDEDGVMGCQIIEWENAHLLYYIGWNKAVTVPFRNAVGVAISKDNGLTFDRLYKGPILDRSIHDPCFVASLCVLNTGMKYQMWYLSCIDWLKKNDLLLHKYHIKYAESHNGIDWIRNGAIAIDFASDSEYAISVPRVIVEEKKYKMWYSFRATQANKNYQLGYAESDDGIRWKRIDNVNFIGLHEEWDSEMQCYPFVFKYNQRTYMLYNGNAYGKTGIGLALLDQ
ncbi:MAG TPA: hypothetical protein PK937_14840 [bacterium]|nr:hypothetical protein [bacterium]HNH33900.1 hypothetical protein [bacterium]